MFALWAPYFALNSVFPGPAIAYGGGLAIAAASVAGVLIAGGSLEDCGLRPRRPSRLTVAIVAGSAAVSIPVVVAIGRLQPWDWGGMLVAAPASAVAQEVYFRGTLQLALSRRFRFGRSGTAVSQAGLFALWHLRAFRAVPPAQAVAVIVIAFAAGLIWGLLALRDRTIAWTLVHHAFYLLIQ